MPEIIYKEECKEIYGLLFKAQNELGTNFQEKHYQKIFESLLIKNNISYKKESPIRVEYEDKLIGSFFADFIIMDKILLEFKCVPRITQDYIKQTLRYIQALNLKLGLIVNFRNYPLKPIRVLNSRISYS
jgi:GxxExxY protein